MTGSERARPPALVAGQGLALRPPGPEDRTRWLELLTDPAQLRFGMPADLPVPRSVEDLDARVDAARRAHAEQEPATFVVVAEDEPGRLLGTVGWSLFVPRLLGVADVGYSVHPDARRRGVAQRGLGLLTHWLTSAPDGPQLARVQLDHSVENPVSCRVALAAGLAQEGIRVGFLPLRDPEAAGGVRRHDVCLHGVLAGS